MKTPSILIVHSSPEALELYAEGYATYFSPAPKLLTCTHNAAALDLCAEHSVDLLITNLSRSSATSGPDEGDGLVLLEKVKKQFPAIPVFIATGSVSGPQYRRALELGADLWFSLPAGNSDLMFAVASRLGLQITKS